jgi:hypothetical protein
MLEIRIDELAALERIEEVSRTEAFAESAKAAAKKPFAAVKAVVERPVETAKGIPAGVGRFARRVYRKARKGVHAARDAKADHDEKKRAEEEQALAAGEPDRPQPSPSPAAGPGDERSAAQLTGDVAKDVFGWSAARRAWAKQLRIDPYTTNPVLRERLDEVAWAAFAGGFAIGTVMPTLPAAVGTTTTVSDLVWTLPPPDLEALNEKRLGQMGIEGRPVRDLFRNRHLTPTLQTQLVDALEALRGVGGRRDVIALAATAASEEDARALCGSLSMLARLHPQRPLDALYLDEDVVSARTPGNAVVLALADDFVSWTDEAAALFAARAYETGERGLWLRGRTSPRAAAELRARRWRVVEGFGSSG